MFKIERTSGSLSWSVFATLRGHHDYVQTVAWSPHHSGHLVSTSADTSVQVREVLEKLSLIGSTVVS